MSKPTVAQRRVLERMAAGGENVAQNARIGTQEPSSTRYGNVVKLQGDPGRDSGPAEVSTTRGDLAMQPEFSRRFIACAHCGSEFFARDRTRIYCRVKCTRDARKLESRDPSAARNQFDVICYVTRDEVIYEPPIEEW